LSPSLCNSSLSKEILHKAQKIVPVIFPEFVRLPQTLIKHILEPSAVVMRSIRDAAIQRAMDYFVRLPFSLLINLSYNLYKQLLFSL
jgi:hypothetical protein